MQVIILILIAICCIMIFQMWKAQKGNANSATRDSKKLSYSPDELRIENVGKGGVIHLRGIGENLEDYDVKILSKHIYREGESTWYELEGDTGDGKVWISYEEDDDLEITIKIKELKMREIGVKVDDLWEMDDEEEGKITYNNDKYYYEDSSEAVFYRFGSDDNAEKFYYWEFETDNSDKFISVEKWGNDFEVTFSVPVRSSQITVYSLND